jgi:hypothetical protein
MMTLPCGHSGYLQCIKRALQTTPAYNRILSYCKCWSRFECLDWIACRNAEHFPNEYGRSHAHDGGNHDLETMTSNACQHCGFSLAQPHLPMYAVSVFDLLGQHDTVLWSFNLTSKSLSNRLLREHILQNATNTFYWRSELLATSEWFVCSTFKKPLDIDVLKFIVGFSFTIKH